MITALIRLTRPYYTLPLSCGLIVISSYVVGGDLSVIGFKLILIESVEVGSIEGL